MGVRTLGHLGTVGKTCHWDVDVAARAPACLSTRLSQGQRWALL